MATMLQIIRGLQILSTYEPNGECAAEHDEIYAKAPKKVSPEHAKELDDLGWFWTDDYESWCHSRNAWTLAYG